MGYSDNYTISVPYSGSVSYPASENGGSTSYSGTVSVDITVYVNSDPFDNSVHRFNNSVDALTGSVVAMNAAQCAAIKLTAEEITAHLNNGFFDVINSELSQQIVALGNEMASGLVLLTEQGRAVSQKKDAMEGDYNRISSRYVSVFTELDNECHKRIYELDKPAFRLAEKVQRELLSETSGNAVALNLLGIEEVSSSKTLVLISSMKRKALDVLKTLHDYITQESKISSLVESVLFNEAVESNVSIGIPVIWSESDGDIGLNRECFIPGCIDHNGKQAITGKVDQFCQSSSGWKEPCKADKEALTKEFNTLAESHYANADGETDQRVYNTMLSLWQNSQLLFTKGA